MRTFTLKGKELSVPNKLICERTREHFGQAIEKLLELLNREGRNVIHLCLLKEDQALKGMLSK